MTPLHPHNSPGGRPPATKTEVRKIVIVSIRGRGGDGGIPPNCRGSGENQARGPGGNGIGCPMRRKIGRIGGPTVGRGSDGRQGVRGKIKMFIPTDYKSILMTFMVEFAKNR
ncbi:MAG: hypothetical protein FD143_3197 [Ignavibacteria bacterium]|nr:MAG: hypothetical protein FD143_3197 [Ignavibacteria bacterium]